MSPPAIELTRVIKDYRGLRPLRIGALSVASGEVVVLAGLDAAAAEIFTNLVSGATLPDSGTVHVLGQTTAGVEDADKWIAFLDRFGIVSARVVLLDMFSVEQNVAVPLTLGIDPLDPAVRDTAAGLAREAGIAAADLARPMQDRSPLLQARVRLARALALGPRILVLEHPTVGLPRADAPVLARDVLRVARTRRLTVIAITGDGAFAGVLADRIFTVDPASGSLTQQGLLGRIFGRTKSS